MGIVAISPGDAVRDPLLDLLDDTALGSVLDLASGRGAFLERLAALDRGLAWLALDTSHPQCQAARVLRLKESKGGPFRLNGAPLLLLRGDAGHIPLKDEAMDTVACSFSLHHLPRPESALREACRILRPGGRLILVEPLADGLRNTQTIHRDLHHLAAALDRRRGEIHRPTYRRRDLLRLMGRLPLDWRWRPWSPPDIPAGMHEELAPVLDTMQRLAGELRRLGHRAGLEARLELLKGRVRREGYGMQTQFCAVGVKT